MKIGGASNQLRTEKCQKSVEVVSKKVGKLRREGTKLWSSGPWSLSELVSTPSVHYVRYNHLKQFLQVHEKKSNNVWTPCLAIDRIALLLYTTEHSWSIMNVQYIDSLTNKMNICM